MVDWFIRECHSSDFSALIEIWREVDLTLGYSDTPQELQRLLDRNPTTCLVAIADNNVVGGVMGGFDGRRGLVHHLAVKPVWQGRGIGRELMMELDRRYRKLGVVKYSFWIEPRNSSAINFYSSLDYELRDLITMSRTIKQ